MAASAARASRTARRARRAGAASDGKPWTELPGEKNIKWVDVQTVLRKLAVFEKPAYLIFCRTNELLVDHTFKKRKAVNPYEKMPPIPFVEGKQFFYLETHGKHTAIKFDALPEYYKRPDTFYYRAPPGRICSQYGLEYGYIPYDYTMSCFMSGVKSDTTHTNDLLHLDGMTIMLRDYSDEHCDISVLERSDTLKNTFTKEGNGSKGLASIKENPSPVDEEHSKNTKKGGSVKRKRRKRKTRKR